LWLKRARFFSSILLVNWQYVGLAYSSNVNEARQVAAAGSRPDAYDKQRKFPAEADSALFAARARAGALASASGYLADELISRAISAADCFALCPIGRGSIAID
jgi:hypothetical protein